MAFDHTILHGMKVEVSNDSQNYFELIDIGERFLENWNIYEIDENHQTLIDNNLDNKFRYLRI